MNEYALFNTQGLDAYAKPMDIEYDENGLVKKVEGVKVIDQLIVKALFTKFGANPIRPLYGASFASITGVKLDQAFSGIMLTTETERVVNRIAQFTQQNLNLTPDQRITAIEDILLDSTDDPRNTVITILVRTESGDSQSLQVPIVNPS